MKKIFFTLSLVLFGSSFASCEEKEVKKVLVIKASSFGEKSVSKTIGDDVVLSVKNKYPQYQFTTRDLTKKEIVPLTKEEIEAFYTPAEGQTKKMKKAVKLSNELTKEFLNADLIILESPMWNFSISSNLKCYIDKIVRSNLTFKVNQDGSYEGLVKNKKMIIISARGGDYSKEMKSYDFQNPYLKTIFGFLGIADIEFITSEGIYEKNSKKRAEIAKEKAQERIKEVIKKL